MDVPRRKDPEKSSRYSSKRLNKNIVRGSNNDISGKQSSAASANFGQSNLSVQEDDEFDDRSSLHGLYQGRNSNEFSNQLLAKQQSIGEGDVHMYVPPVAIDSEILFNNENGPPTSLTRKDRSMSQDKVITVRQLDASQNETSQ